MSVARDAPGLDPDEAAGREFSKVRRGLDPAQVRIHLNKLAQEIRRLQGVEKKLRSEIDNRVETPPEPDLDVGDPAAMTRMLGEETVRIIDAAREAADEIRSKAEESAGRVVRDAHERASKMTREALEARDAAAAEAEELTTTSREEAETTVSAAKAEAESLLATAEAESTAKLEEAERILEEKTAEAEEEAARIRESADEALAEAKELAAQRIADAEAAAEAIAEQSEIDVERELDEARERGREMIREAKEARERMIRDLAERRHASRQQLEALRAGRERLIDAFATAREALDDATDELVDSLPSAREAADLAARAVEEDLDAAVGELDALISRGASADELIEGDADLAIPLPKAGDERENENENENEDESAGSDAEMSEVDHDAADADAEVVSIDGAGPDDELDDFELLTDGSSAIDETDETDEPVGGHLRLVSSNDGSPSPAGLEALTGGPDADVPKKSGEVVEELFARIRADRTGDDDLDLDDLDLDDDDEDDDEDEEAAASPGAVVIDLSSVDDRTRSGTDADAADVTDEAEADDADAGEPGEAFAHQAQLDRRDELIGDLVLGVGRRVRRVVTDQENGLLDLVRRNRKLKTSGELLPSRETQLSAYRSAIEKDLRKLIEAGAEYLTGSHPEAGAIDSNTGLDELMALVGEWVVDPLRAKLAKVVDASDDSSQDRSELVDSIRATYREWRNERIGELSGDVATLAFSKGVMAAAKPGQKLCWVVDHGGLPCPDGEDNQLAGPVTAGDEYPTGDRCPPAHPGCRCLLIPEPE